jgi:4-hydroxybenzoate polyprenyltransferase
MTNILKLAFRVSRVRFWLYLGGTYLIGYLIGIGDIQALLDPFFIIQVFYFMIPANIFLYGINDISDKDTDMFNPKKDVKEYKANQTDLISQLLFISWMLLSFFYSAKPIRFKAVPFLDFISNFLYVIPALLAYYQATAIIPAFLPVFAAFLWTSAMQLFSAIPDIEADAKANIKTTAVLIGRSASLILCFIFWIGFAFILVFITPWNSPWNILMFVYPAVPLYVMLRENVDINRVYWMFPYWTGIFGMVLFFSTGLPLLGVF